MRAVRVTAYQNMVSYRLPSSFVIKESYPLPPYSNVIGMVHAACDFKEYVPMKVSIQGCNASSISENYIKYEFGRYTKYEAGRHNVLLQNGEDTLGMTRGMGHIELLTDVRLIFHIIPEEDDMIEPIYQGLKYPKNYLSLGRWEDLLRIDSVVITELDTADLNSGMELPCDAYIPVEDPQACFMTATTYKLHKRYTVDPGLKVRQWTESIEAKHACTGTTIDPDLEVLIDQMPCRDADCPYANSRVIPVFPA